MSNAITVENTLTGTTAWQVTQASTTQIAGYVDKSSYNVGDTVTFFVSTQVASTAYTIKIYRLGWYGGNGAALKFTSPSQTGVAQGYWDESGQTLHNCPSAILDSTTHLQETGWASSYTWAVPSGACTGVYLAQFTDASGYQSYCSFVVKGNSPADACYIRPTTTDEAYNDWGGYSLYSTTRAYKVSSNRPNALGNGTGGLFRFEIAGIKWLERQGYNLSYLTSVDVHSNAAQLLNYHCFLTAGHDEYWSREMRDGTEAAIAAGVNAAFLGANTCYWQCRFENDNAGHANRTITCYKVEAGLNTLYTEPFFNTDNTRLTCQWRESPVNRPEQSMVGIMYSSFLAVAANVGWTVDANATSSYLTGTGLVNGTTYGYDCVGYEYDHSWPNKPANLQIIATSPVTDSVGRSDFAQSSIYVAPSGAIVFATGSIQWVNALDVYRYSVQAGGTPAEIAGMQAFFGNVLADLIKAPTKVYSFCGF